MIDLRKAETTPIPSSARGGDQNLNRQQMRVNPASKSGRSVTPVDFGPVRSSAYVVKSPNIEWF